MNWKNCGWKTLPNHDPRNAIEFAFVIPVYSHMDKNGCISIHERWLPCTCTLPTRFSPCVKTLQVCTVSMTSCLSATKPTNAPNIKKLVETAGGEYYIVAEGNAIPYLLHFFLILDEWVWALLYITSACLNFVFKIFRSERKGAWPFFFK